MRSSSMESRSKVTNASLDNLNEAEFGQYFIGLNKENKNTLNGDEAKEKNGNDDIKANIHPQNANSESGAQNGLTPLNVNTKLSFSAKDSKESKDSKSNTIRLYEIPKNRKKASDIKSLPPLPNTPSPPRSAKRRTYVAKKYIPPFKGDGGAKHSEHYQSHRGYHSHHGHARHHTQYQTGHSKQSAYHHQPQHQHHTQGQAQTYNNKYNAAYSQQSGAAQNDYQRFDEYYTPSTNQRSYYDQHWYSAQTQTQPQSQNGVDQTYYSSNRDAYYGHRAEYEYRSNYNAQQSYRSNAQSSSTTSYIGHYSKYNKAPRFQSAESHETDGALSNDHSKTMSKKLIACKYWTKGIVCRNGDLCAYSHATKCEDGRKRVTNYKTKPCVDPGRGLKCEYEDRCNFAHPGEALRRPMPIEYPDRQYFKLLLRDCPTNRYPFGIFV